MLRLPGSPTFGKIYQVLYTSNQKLCDMKDTLLIQTYGMKMEGGVTCTTEARLLEILRGHAGSTKDVVIVSISTLRMDAEMHKMFRMLNCLGVSLYLSTFCSKLLWYADEVLDM
jgi:hypothetical protein